MPNSQPQVALPPELQEAMQLLGVRWRASGQIEGAWQRNLTRTGLVLLNGVLVVAFAPKVMEAHARAELASADWLLSQRLREWTELNPAFLVVSPDDYSARLAEQLTSERGETLLNEWCSREAFARRRRDLEEGLSCHFRGEYNSACRTWFSVLEAIAREELGLNRKSPFSRQLDEALSLECFETLGDGSFEQLAAARALSAWYRAAGKATHESEPTRLNRNRIVHDADVELPEQHSLQCISAVDSLHELCDRRDQRAKALSVTG